MEGRIRVTLVATGLGQTEELAMPRTGMLEQPIPQPQVPVQNTAGYGNAYQPKPAVQPTNTGYYPNQAPQQGFNQAPQQQNTGSAHPQQPSQPSNVDANRMWSPSSIPGFMRNGR